MTKYIRIANRIKEQIALHSQSSIYKLPTEMELSKTYRVSRQTIRLALALLEQEGVITKRQGSGSFANLNSFLNITKEYAILLSSDTEYLFPTYLNTIQDCIRKNNAKSSFYNTNGDILKERSILSTLLSSSVNGIIIEAIQNNLPTPNIDLFEQLCNKGIRIYFLNAPYPNLPATSHFYCDDFFGGYLAGKHLLSKNHSKIGCIFSLDTSSGINRYLGLSSSMRDSGVFLTSEHVCWFTVRQLTNLQKKSDTSFLSHYMNDQLRDCSSIVCQNDEIAYWLEKICQKSGYQIPVDISILSFDNSYLSDLANIPISSFSIKRSDFTTSLNYFLENRQDVNLSVSWHLNEKDSVYTLPST